MLPALSTREHGEVLSKGARQWMDERRMNIRTQGSPQERRETPREAFSPAEGREGRCPPQGRLTGLEGSPVRSLDIEGAAERAGRPEPPLGPGPTAPV